MFHRTSLSLATRATSFALANLSATGVEAIAPLHISRLQQMLKLFLQMKPLHLIVLPTQKLQIRDFIRAISGQWNDVINLQLESR